LNEGLGLHTNVSSVVPALLALAFVQRLTSLWGVRLLGVWTGLATIRFDHNWSHLTSNTNLTGSLKRSCSARLTRFRSSLFNNILVVATSAVFKLSARVCIQVFLYGAPAAGHAASKIAGAHLSAGASHALRDHYIVLHSVELVAGQTLARKTYI